MSALGDVAAFPSCLHLQLNPWLPLLGPSLGCRTPLATGTRLFLGRKCPCNSGGAGQGWWRRWQRCPGRGPGACSAGNGWVRQPPLSGPVLGPCGAWSEALLMPWLGGGLTSQALPKVNWDTASPPPQRALPFLRLPCVCVCVCESVSAHLCSAQSAKSLVISPRANCIFRLGEPVPLIVPEGPCAHPAQLHRF